jgi:hypothetical protein
MLEWLWQADGALGPRESRHLDRVELTLSGRPGEGRRAVTALAPRGGSGGSGGGGGTVCTTPLDCPCTRRPGMGNCCICPMGAGQSNSAVINARTGGSLVLYAKQGAGVPFLVTIPPRALRQTSRSSSLKRRSRHRSTTSTTRPCTSSRLSIRRHSRCSSSCRTATRAATSRIFRSTCERPEVSFFSHGR